MDSVFGSQFVAMISTSKSNPMLSLYGPFQSGIVILSDEIPPVKPNEDTEMSAEAEITSENKVYTAGNTHTDKY